MARFIEGEERGQLSLLPTSLDEYVDADNPVRVVDAFIDELDLAELGFTGVLPAATGRPAYHPSMLLKLYLYGYLNCVQSSRRLEREAKRNLEVMWLTGRLMPDFKTIADFRKSNGASIQSVCGKFVEICVEIGLFKHAVAAIDGAKFKAVNSRDRNFTRGKLKRRMEQITESIGRYLEALDVADRQDGADEKIAKLRDKIAAMRARLAELKQIEQQMHDSPDQQISLTDPDARAMATSMRGAGVVGYNVQVAVDAEHHLIVAHEVTNVVVDRTLLAPMAAKAKQAMRTETLEAFADRGYFSGEQLLACEKIGVTPYVPKPRTSNARAECRFDKEDFDYLARKRRLSVPDWRIAAVPNDQPGRRSEFPHVLEQQLRRLRFETAMHHGQGAASAAVGARARRRCDARSARRHARCHDASAPNGRASLRHAEGLDGPHALPDERA
jgi:transposase